MRTPGFNLEEVATVSVPLGSLEISGLAQPRWGWVICRYFPRVAAKARQPWALGRNRFAVGCLDRPSLVCRAFSTGGSRRMRRSGFPKS